jgi:hypothetical protein
MRVFLSYASEQRALAERTCRVLESEGSEVFFDRDDLDPGDAYGERIRAAMMRSQVFVFFVSRYSIAPSYALTELSIVQSIPARRRPRTLPVLTEPLDLETLPPSLKPLTLLEPEGDLPAEVAAQVAEIRRALRQKRLTLAAVFVAILVAGVGIWKWREAAPPAPPTTVAADPAPDPVEALTESVRNRTPESERVTFRGMLANSGWMVNIAVADFSAREIFYRLDEEREFRSLGVHSIRNLMTGQPQPVTMFTLTGPSGAVHDFDVKYVDGKGQEHGPYRFRFDPKVEYVRETKDVLTRVVPDWLSFHEFDGRMLTYFTQLLGSKNAFREIRYSIDSDALDRKLSYTQDWSQKGPPDIERTDENPITIPTTTKYVAVKLSYIDGTESELKRFVLSEVGVERR